ncbi:MAG: PH domain-containing protein [Candidatus Aenigmarchaeota archaeon]|nr:PH domain-containing protein [Candidatus Aenigmarchaeota archaeon]
MEEKLKYETSRISFIFNYFLATLILFLTFLLIPYLSFSFIFWIYFFLFLLVLALILEPEAERFLREYLITNAEVIKIEGILTKKRISIPYQSVADVRVVKGIVGRIFNYGDVIVKGVKDDIVMKGIRNPEAVYELINRKIEAMKRPKGKE